MTDFIRNNKLAVGLAAVVLVAVVVWLAIAVFGVHTLFIDDKVDEADPFAAQQAGDNDQSEDTPSADTSPEGTSPETEEPAEGAPPEIVTLAEGDFIDRSHPAEGDAIVLNDGSEQRFLRFENFSTDNGPDLNVYLSTAPADGDEGAFDDDFVDLGDLKGNIGDQNYEIPPEVDLDRYSTVVVWCVRFSSAFGAAELS